MGIKVLDCTLRDGAYVVNGEFGSQCIHGIVTNLAHAGVDIIECGWLKDAVNGRNSVFYNQPQELDINIQNCALMFDYGKYDVDNLTECSNGVGIIRIAFYKQDLDRISFAAEEVKNKGYKVFLQASNTIEYSDVELEKLCKRANFIGVDAVYIVDSFGSMFPEDLDRIMPVYEELAAPSVQIGFHSHNSIQLSLGLSIQFIKHMKRDIIVDSSLCGLGRGAGNTKTELLLEYLNRRGSSYNTDYIKGAIKNHVEPLYKNYNWEYTPERAFRGLKGLHPYAELNDF